VLVIRPMDRHVLEDVAMLIAREHRDARNRQPLIPDTFDDPQTSHEMLLDLLAAGFVGCRRGRRRARLRRHVRKNQR